MNITTGNSTFAQTKLITGISTILKKNVGSLRKQFRRRTSSIEEEPKRLLRKVSKQLLYILNSHHPLQSKITEIFQRYTNKSKTNSQEEGVNCEALGSKKEPVMDETKDHGVGSNMTEQGMMTDNNYVPLLLNHSSANNNRFPTSIHNRFDETNNIDGKFDRNSIRNVKCQT